MLVVEDEPSVSVLLGLNGLTVLGGEDPGQLCNGRVDVNQVWFTVHFVKCVGGVEWCILMGSHVFRVRVRNRCQFLVELETVSFPLLS